MEGQLKKKGSKRGPFGDSWKDRYFVLEGATMRYYAGGSTEGKLKGEVTIIGVDPCEELQGAKGHKPNRLDFKCADGSKLCASAPSAARRSQWIEAAGAVSSSGGGGAAAAAAAPPASASAPSPAAAISFAFASAADF